MRRALAAVGLFLVSMPVRADDLAENQSRFGEVEGNVQILSQGASDWVDAHIDLPLETGDQIRVDEDSRAELSLANDVLVYLDGGTSVVVGHITTRGGRLTMTHGALVGKVETDGPRGVWEFETPPGVCTVRGTEFAVLYAPDDGTRLAVFKGVVEMSPAETAEGPQPAVVIKAKEEGVLQRNKPFQKLSAYSPRVREQTAHVTLVQKRFRQVSGVWVPMTSTYRTELRRKFIAPLANRKNQPRRTAPSEPRRSRP